MDLNFDDLAFFLAVDRTGSIAAASRELGPDPSTVSLLFGMLNSSASFELARNKFLAPSLVGVTALNGLLAHGGVVGEETVRFTQKLVLDDGRHTTVETLFDLKDRLGTLGVERIELVVLTP